jgi:hypothetical protein
VRAALATLVVKDGAVPDRPERARTGVERVDSRVPLLGRRGATANQARLGYHIERREQSREVMVAHEACVVGHQQAGGAGRSTQK